MKKLLSVLLLAAVLFSLTACNNEIEIPEQFANFEPLPVPEGGWTSETAASVFYINGEPLPEPLTFDNFSSDYSLKEDSVVLSGAGCTLCYQNKELLYLRYDEPYRFHEMPPALIHGITVYHGASAGKIDKKLASMVFFNGITLGATKDEVRAIFGEPDYIDSITGSIWNYNYNRNEHFPCIMFRFNEDGELFTMGLTFWGEEDFEEARQLEEQWKEMVTQSTNYISVDDERVEFPCTFGELSFLELDANSLVFNEENNTAEGAVYSGRYPAGSVVLADCAKGETDFSSKKVARLRLNVESTRELNFYYATFSYWTPPEEVVKYLGEPETPGVYRYPIYNVENAFVEFGFDETLSSLTFSFDS